MDFQIECSAQDAPRFRDWVANRGGVAVWKSINLSNPGASWSTPALDADGKPLGKPTWQAANEPTIVTDPAQIGVYKEVLFKAFRVGLRMAGLSLKLTDAAQARVDRELTKCRDKHGNAHYRKGVMPGEPGIGVFYTSFVVPLTELKEGS